MKIMVNTANPACCVPSVSSEMKDQAKKRHSPHSVVVEWILLNLVAVVFLPQTRV